MITKAQRKFMERLASGDRCYASETWATKQWDVNICYRFSSEGLKAKAVNSNMLATLFERKLVASVSPKGNRRFETMISGHLELTDEGKVMLERYGGGR